MGAEIDLLHGPAPWAVQSKKSLGQPSLPSVKLVPESYMRLLNSRIIMGILSGSVRRIRNMVTARGGAW